MGHCARPSVPAATGYVWREAGEVLHTANALAPACGTTGGTVWSGVADGTRTHDDQNHNLGLYQLSYGHH